MSLSDVSLFLDHYSRRKHADEVNLALHEAEDAFLAEQLLLSSNSIQNLKCYDDYVDL